MNGLLDLVRELDGVEHIELHRRIAAGEELDEKCQAALDKRLALGEKIERCLGHKRDAFEQRMDALIAQHPSFPWPAEVIARQMGLVSAPGELRASFTVAACGCVYDRADRLTSCDSHHA